MKLFYDFVNWKDSNGQTALHIAVDRGHDSAILLLINNFADVDKK